MAAIFGHVGTELRSPFSLVKISHITTNNDITRKYMHAETLALLTKPLYFPNILHVDTSSKVVVMVTR
jgi:hypothetical protein